MRPQRRMIAKIDVTIPVQNLSESVFLYLCMTPVQTSTQIRPKFLNFPAESLQFCAAAQGRTKQRPKFLIFFLVSVEAGLKIG